MAFQLAEAYVELKQRGFKTTNEQIDGVQKNLTKLKTTASSATSGVGNSFSSIDDIIAATRQDLKRLEDGVSSFENTVNATEDGLGGLADQLTEIGTKAAIWTALATGAMKFAEGVIRSVQELSGLNRELERQEDLISKTFNARENQNSRAIARANQEISVEKKLAILRAQKNQLSGTKNNLETQKNAAERDAQSRTKDYIPFFRLSTDLTSSNTTDFEDRQDRLKKITSEYNRQATLIKQIEDAEKRVVAEEQTRAQQSAQAIKDTYDQQLQTLRLKNIELTQGNEAAEQERNRLAGFNAEQQKNLQILREANKAEKDRREQIKEQEKEIKKLERSAESAQKKFDSAQKQEDSRSRNFGFSSLAGLAEQMQVAILGDQQRKAEIEQLRIQAQNAQELLALAKGQGIRVATSSNNKVEVPPHGFGGKS
jgi:hypothetical protein